MAQNPHIHGWLQMIYSLPLCPPDLVEDEGECMTLLRDEINLIAHDNDEETENCRRASLPATLRQADRGFFGHTAVSSPKLISPQNKDFTFGKSPSPNSCLN